MDLLPSDELGPWYATAPARDAPVHVARVWDRYSGNEDYFGGVAARAGRAGLEFRQNFDRMFSNASSPS